MKLLFITGLTALHFVYANVPTNIQSRIDAFADEFVDRFIDHEQKFPVGVNAGSWQQGLEEINELLSGVKYSDFKNPTDVGIDERRWTDAGRPWTREYSKFRRVMKLLLNATTSDPKLVQHAAPMLRGYGCWCLSRGDRDFSNGRGAPVEGDPIDKICKAFGQCKTCIQLENPSCNVVDQKYKFDIVEETFDDGAVTVDMICRDPEGSCPWSSCTCDREYIMEFIDALISGKYIQSHSQIKKFNPADFERWNSWEENCLIQNRANTIHTPDQCCGVIPRWKTFDTQAGTLGCCVNRIYSLETHTCDAGELENKSSL